jgi:DUF4097 and DUF4098 domain-containing protein YvlB
MKLVARAAGAFALTLAAGCVQLVGEECRLTAPRDGAVAVGDAERVRVVALAGSLRVEGRTALAEVVARGIACAASEERLEEVELRVERRGVEVVVEVRIPERSGLGSAAGLDLVVELPDSLPLEVSDTSGEAEIRDVAALSLDDGSGEVWIERVAGEVSIVDGSGSLDVADVGGSVRIEDGSGDLDVQRVGESLEIEDGSGGIAVAEVRGDVVVLEDGSGEIEATGVGGDFVVRDDGSGGISAAEVTGDFTVEHDGSGSIRHERVGGRVSVPAD